MKKYIACRIRNGIDIVEDFIDYYDDFDGFFFYDDHSDDGTRYFLENHPKVAWVMDDGKESWSPNSWSVQSLHRNLLCKKALSEIDDDDFLFLLDCDEFMEIKVDLTQKDTLWLDLYDFVMTDEDFDKPRSERDWALTHKRSIMFGCKKKNWSSVVSHRTIKTKGKFPQTSSGYVRHYGRSRTVDQFEKKCDFYSSHGNKAYVKKWSSRKGNGVYVVDEIKNDNKFMKWSQFIENQKDA